jgi:uncharacterized membrane protein
MKQTNSIFFIAFLAKFLYYIYIYIYICQNKKNLKDQQKRELIKNTTRHNLGILRSILI